MSKGQPRPDAHGWNSRLLAAKLSRAATCGVEALVGLSSSSASMLSSFDSTDATACCRKPPHPEFCFAGLRGDAILVSDSEGSQAMCLDDPHGESASYERRRDFNEICSGSVGHKN